MGVISLIATHGAVADHFALYAGSLQNKGYQVEVHARENLAEKFTQQGINVTSVISLEDPLEEIAERCKNAAIVITGVDHFSEGFHDQIKIANPDICRMAYYDNPESYVPGGYSEVAARVMQNTHKVLFANRNLTKETIYRAPEEEIDLSFDQREGIGYYPVEEAEKLKKAREEKQQSSEKKAFVYLGGNNDEFYQEAFPALIEFLNGLGKNSIEILYQRHPGAKDKNLDIETLEKLQKPELLQISEYPTNKALEEAKGVLYHQTSMGPLCVLADIPMMQITRRINKDLLVKNELCPVATDLSSFLEGLERMFDVEGCFEERKQKVLEALGYSEEWENNLIEIIKSVSFQEV